MDNTIQKPIEITRQEFVEGLIQYINNSPLPAFAVADVLDEVTPLVKKQIKEDYEMALEHYAHELQKLQEEEEKRKTEQAVKALENEQKSKNERKNEIDNQKGR